MSGFDMKAQAVTIAHTEIQALMKRADISAAAKRAKDFMSGLRERSTLDTVSRKMVDDIEAVAGLR